MTTHPDFFLVCDPRPSILACDIWGKRLFTLGVLLSIPACAVREYSFSPASSSISCLVSSSFSFDARVMSSRIAFGSA